MCWLFCYNLIMLIYVKLIFKKLFSCNWLFQIVEFYFGEGGEVIVSILIKISVCLVYSKYVVLLVSDINFGVMIVNIKKICVFVIEN